MSRMADALQQIDFARGYTADLLKNVDSGDWFRRPTDGVTHIAWQVGHLAVAEYRLALQRIRGELPEDDQLVPQPFRSTFGKGSTPDPSPANNPDPDEILDVFRRVHKQVLSELPQVPDRVLDEPPGSPHPLFDTKLGALRWAAQHEMLHAGQIGLLRRLLGHTALR